MSHTSLPSQTGPTEAKTCRRSASVFATRRWIAPAPRSKPSSKTYTVIIMATRQNQMVPMHSSICRDGDRRLAAQRIIGLGSVLDLAIHEKQPEDAQHGIQAHESDQREPRIARAYPRRDSVRGAHQPIDEPGLTPELRGHPSCGIGNVWLRNANHQ